MRLSSVIAAIGADDGPQGLSSPNRPKPSSPDCSNPFPGRSAKGGSLTGRDFEVYAAGGSRHGSPLKSARSPPNGGRVPVQMSASGGLKAPPGPKTPVFV